MKVLLLALVTLFLFVKGSQGQIACAASSANTLKDYGFEVGSTYCRNNSVDLDVDDITLCVINYNGANLTYDLGSSTQTNLETQFAPGGWTSSGEVDVITGNYQTVHGFWAAKLNGQFAAGSISQSFQISAANPQCSSVYYSAPNSHSPDNYTATYTVQLTKAGVATPVFSETKVTSPNNLNNGHPLFSTSTATYTLPGPGTYTLSFISDDTTPVVFNDGLYPTQTYFGRTGAIVDDICFSCLATPSPSVTPSVSASVSISATSSISVSATSSTSFSASPSISHSATSSISVSATSSISVTRTALPSISASPSISISATSSVSPSPSPSTTASVSAAPSVSVSPSLSASPLPACPGPYATDDDEAFRIFEAVAHSNLSDDDEDQTVVNLYFADILNKGNDHHDNY